MIDSDPQDREPVARLFRTMHCRAGSGSDPRSCAACCAASASAQFYTINIKLALRRTGRLTGRQTERRGWCLVALPAASRVRLPRDDRRLLAVMEKGERGRGSRVEGRGQNAPAPPFVDRSRAKPRGVRAPMPQTAPWCTRCSILILDPGGGCIATQHVVHTVLRNNLAWLPANIAISPPTHLPRSCLMPTVHGPRPYRPTGRVPFTRH
eukprot:scaffold238_cov111-Isochrysis_galbana.AAC.5